MIDEETPVRCVLWKAQKEGGRTDSKRPSFDATTYRQPAGISKERV